MWNLTQKYGFQIQVEENQTVWKPKHYRVSEIHTSSDFRYCLWISKIRYPKLSLVWYLDFIRPKTCVKQYNKCLKNELRSVDFSQKVFGFQMLSFQTCVWNPETCVQILNTKFWITQTQYFESENLTNKSQDFGQI